MSLGIDFSTLAGVAAVNVFITEAIVKGCNVQKDWLKQLISWITPVVLCVVGLLCQLGLFANYGTIGEWQAWVYTLVTGIGLGLTSNGMFDLPFVKQFLEWLVKLLSKKKEVNEGAELITACNQDAPLDHWVEPVKNDSDTCARRENNMPCAITDETEINSTKCGMPPAHHEECVMTTSANENEIKFAPKVMVESRYVAASENPIQETKKTPKRVRKTKTQKV